MSDDLDKWWAETARQAIPTVYWHVQFDPFHDRRCLVGAINLRGGSQGAKCPLSDAAYRARNSALVKLVALSVVDRLPMAEAIFPTLARP
jgi:hypothetical protein